MGDLKSQGAPLDSNGSCPVVLVNGEINKYGDGEEEDINFESTLDDLDNCPQNKVTILLERYHTKIGAAWSANQFVNSGRNIVLATLFHVYLGFVLWNYATVGGDIGWCNGSGFLFICVTCLYTGLFYGWLKKLEFLKWKSVTFTAEAISTFVSSPCVQYVTSALVCIGLVAFIIIDTNGHPKRLVSAFGLLLLIGVGVLFSKHPFRIRWRHVLWGVGLQVLLAVLILRCETGRFIVQCLSDKISGLLHFVTDGTSFVYGHLSTGLTLHVGNDTSEASEIKIPGVFAFKGLCSVYLFTFLVEILYHYGVMPWVVANMGWILEISVGTTSAESMSVAANIFLGMTTAPLVIKPFVPKMTNSELHCMMAGGFATIAGAAFGAYVAFGINAFHLLSASFMSAPAALLYAKILYPETKKSLTNSAQIYAFRPQKSGSAIDAGVRGASQAVFIILNIIAGIIAILGAVGLLNYIINWLGVLAGVSHLSFEWLVAQLFVPVSWALGVDDEEIHMVASLLGTKTVINEFVAYTNLSRMCLSPRSITIATYALCCFANLGSIGITLGSLATICPERAKDASKVVFSAFVAGNVAALLTACVAGALSTDMGYKEWIATNATCMTTVTY